MEGRICTTKNAATRLGIPPRVLLQMFREDKDFPRPVRDSTHHKWWDFKAIELYFDKKSKIQPDSVDYSAIIKGRLKNGKDKNALPC